jgi:hypothetical protein
MDALSHNSPCSILRKTYNKSIFFLGKTDAPSCSCTTSSAGDLMKKTLVHLLIGAAFLAAGATGGATAHAQGNTPAIDHMEPPFWWAGMTW